LVFNPLNLIRGKKFTAIDFGHHSIKVAQCRVGGDDITLLGWGDQKLPRGAMENGQVEDISMVAGELKNAMDNSSISPSNIIFSPAVGQEFVRKHDMPRMPEDELEEALRWEVEEYLNLPPERVASDFIILEENEDELEVLLVVLPENVLGGYQKVFNKLNYSARVANVQELALISLLSYQGRMEEPSLVINLGDQMSRIVIAKEDDFYLSRSVEIAGRHFTRVFKNPERTWVEAENAKRKASLPQEQEEDESDMDIDMMVNQVESGEEGQAELLSLAEELVSEINRSLDYYNNRFSEEEISHIYITGGGFRLQGLKEYVDNEVELSLTEIDPVEDINDRRVDYGGSGDTMAVPLGLVASEVLHDES